jgi:3-oxoacyl-[acyl-carrier-protein] synthase II
VDHTKFITPISFPRLNMRRVVVSGVGMVSPLGCGNESVFRLLCAGYNPISPLNEVQGEGSWTSENTKPRSLAVSLAALVPTPTNTGKSLDVVPFDIEKAIGKGASRDKSLFINYALHASDLALQHAKLDLSNDTSPYKSERAGVALASGIGAINETVDASQALDTSERKLSPYFVPKILINMAAGNVSLRHGLRGPNHSVATACAAGAHAIGDAFNFIRLGYADVMLAGGSEACVGALGVSGFGRMRALSTSTDPHSASRPFHPERDGFVIGEGAAIVILEHLETALAREAPIIAELVGYGLSGDAYHPTTPSPMGDGAVRSMRSALECAGVKPEQVDYINAHATSTPTGDSIEMQAIETVFGDRNESNSSGPLIVSSTKGSTGHMLGAAGAFEGAATALATRDGLLPPTLGGLERLPFEKFRGLTSDTIQILPGPTAYPYPVEYAMSNSFGFGGTNASLLFKKWSY